MQIWEGVLKSFEIEKESGRVLLRSVGRIPRGYVKQQTKPNVKKLRENSVNFQKTISKIKIFSLLMIFVFF